jgi:hypothetical protein
MSNTAIVESIPIVDFKDFKTNPKKVAQDVFEACKSIGFFYMINHDLPQADIDRAFELVSCSCLLIFSCYVLYRQDLLTGIYEH